MCNKKIFFYLVTSVLSIIGFSMVVLFVSAPLIKNVLDEIYYTLPTYRNSIMARTRTKYSDSSHLLSNSGTILDEFGFFMLSYSDDFTANYDKQYNTQSKVWFEGNVRSRSLSIGVILTFNDEALADQGWRYRIYIWYGGLFCESYLLNTK